MSLFGCSCRNFCRNIVLVISAIIGVIAAFLRITGVITVSAAFLWVTFGIAIVYLAILLFSVLIAPRPNQPDCTDSTASALIIGTLGTVLFSVILLAIPFAVTSVVGAIFTGALLFFFSLAIGSTGCFIQQLI